MSIQRPALTKHFVSDHAQQMMVALWYAGKDTLDIARALSLPEHDIANRLPMLRQRHKQMRGGG